MPIAFLTYSAFVEMFEPSQDFSGYEDDEGIDIQWKTVPCKNTAREAGGWCAFLWKPASEVYDGKWIRQEYNGSSPFAMWWSDIADNDKPDACKDCGAKPTWIAAFERWSVVDDLCEECYAEEDD